MTSAAGSLIPTQELRGETEPKNLEYAITKGIIKKLLKEIAAARKKIRTQQQQERKGKRKIIITESSDDKEELGATTIDIIEDATANKVPVETQFQRFVEAGALPGRPKKAKITHTSTPENIVDLMSTPPPPSPTKVIEELVPEQLLVSLLDLCKSAMSEAVKEKFDRDRDL